MKINTKQRVCSTIIRDLEKGKISLTHKLQRKEVWSTRQKSLLIDSILKGYQFYPIFMAEDKETKRLDVIDGVQRISAIRDFMNGAFRLGRDCGPIIIDHYVEKDDGTTVINHLKYDVAGKKFSKLDQELQDMIVGYEVTVMTASDYTDQEIREMFSRLNNGSPLSNTQKNVVDYSYEFLGKLNKCLEDPFWGNTAITATDIRKDKDREVLLQCLYVVSDEEVGGFKNSNIQPFAKSLQDRDDNYVNNLFNAIYDVIEEFNKVIINKLPNFNKMSIAPVFAGANEFVTIDENNGYHVYDVSRLSIYAEKVKAFFEDGYDDSEYAETIRTMGGTAGKENVMYRINFFRDIARSCIINDTSQNVEATQLELEDLIMEEKSKNTKRKTKQ